MINSKVKAASIVCAFIIAYLISTYISFAIFFNFNIVQFFKDSWLFIVVGCVLTVLSLFITKMHSFSLSRVSAMEGVKAFVANFIIFAINVFLCLAFDKLSVRWCLICWLLFLLLSFIIIYGYKYLRTLSTYISKKKDTDKTNVLIVGAGDAGTTILRELQNSDKTKLNAVGFIDDDKIKQGVFICGVKVLGGTEDIKRIADAMNVGHLIIAMPSASPATLKKITDMCVATKRKVQILPGIYQLLNGQAAVSKLRDVDVEDLLGREPAKINLDEVMGYIENKIVLVTGGGGSIGSELCRQVAVHNPKRLIILDIYENNVYEIEQELKRKQPDMDLVTLIASVRDGVKIDDVFKKYRPQIVFHAAAHKHVPLMETSPNEAVKNNVLGTYNTVKSADKYKAERFVLISTDKAVNPTNIMGATKRICEMIIQAFSRRSETSFAAVRFGNVLGSNGSVIPLFKKQIEEGGPVTVTHKDIIRYFMTIPEAVSLVLQAGAYAKGGEIFVLNMGEQVRIYELAENLIRLSGYEPHKDIKIVCTGLRPGEKLFEERLMAEEGLTKTENNLISIGKPIEFDDEKLFATIDELYKEAYNESDKIRELVHTLVTTYELHPNAE